MRLYNMDSDEQWRGKFKRGDSWRGDTIYECILCFSKTNLWKMSGGHTYGPRIFCPAEKDISHGELLDTFRRHSELNNEIKEYKEIMQYATEIDKTIVGRMMEDLHVRRNLLELKVKKLRGELSGRYDNIQGMAYSGYAKPLYPSFCYSRPARKFGRGEAVAKWLYEHEEQGQLFGGDDEPAF